MQVVDAQHGRVAHRSSCRLGVGGVLDDLPDGEEREHEERDRESRRHDVPPRALVDRARLEAVVEQRAPRERVRVAEAEVREPGLAEDRERDDQDGVGPHERHHVGQDVAAHDPDVRGPLRARALDELALAQREHLRAHDARRPRPAGDREHEHDDAGPAARDPPRVVLQERRHEHRERYERDHEEPVVEEGQHAVDPAAEVAGADAHDRSDHGRRDAGDEADDERDAGAEQELREQVAPRLVRPEPVRGRGPLEAVREVEAARRERILGRDQRAEDRHQHDERDHREPEGAERAAPDEAHGAHAPRATPRASALRSWPSRPATVSEETGISGPARAGRGP